MENSQEIPFYCRVLSEELEKRKARNPNYSQRAFARDLGVNQALLSRALSNKALLSREQMNLILANLNLNDIEKQTFIESFLWSWWKRQKRYTHA